MKKIFVGGGVIFLFLISNTAFAAVSHSDTIVLQPGWNIVSTPRLLDSHSFSLSETSAQLSIYILDASRPSGWATMAELGQTEFTPLYGYFINNKSTTTQTLTLNYKDMASSSPDQRLFERTFSHAGWYSFGIANPSYAKEQGSTTVDTDNPDHILNSLLGVTSNYDSVVDFTDASYGTDPDSVALVNEWKLATRSADVTNTTEINSLNDFRETKGYAIYITASTTYSGFQEGDESALHTRESNGATIAVTLASSSHAVVFNAGDSDVKLSAFTITNNTATETKVTSLTFTRTGVSNDRTIANVYLSITESGDARITGPASLISGKVSFSDSNGLVVVPAMSSITVRVRADIAHDIDEQTIGITLTDVVTDGVLLSGLPVSGPQMAIKNIYTDSLHYHLRVVITVNGVEETLPAGIGISTAVDSPIHTHENDNVIHLEFGRQITAEDIRLSEFFKLWGKEWTSTSFMGNPVDDLHSVTMTVNDEPSTGYAHWVMQNNYEVRINYQSL